METKNLKDSVRDTAGRHASRHGAFSAGATALVVAAVLVFNLILAQVPQDYTQFDMTETGIYNITDTSRTYMENLQEDVEIHVLADKEAMDSRIVRFLSKYEELSDRLSVEYVNPTVYPSVLSQYGVDTDTIVVTCACLLYTSSKWESAPSGHTGLSQVRWKSRDTPKTGCIP